MKHSQSGHHWSHQKERASKIGISILLVVLKAIGPKPVRIIIFPVALYYYLTSPETRRVSKNYLSRIDRMTGDQSQAASNFSVYRHILSFAQSMVDRFYSWCDGFTEEDFVFNDVAVVENILRNPNTGAIILVSHLGNFDVAISRSQLTPETTFNIVMNMNHTQTYNQFRGENFYSEQIRFIDPDSINPATMVDLSARIDDGEILIIAADRTPSEEEQGAIDVEFLGDVAKFPIGPYVLAHLLKAPVYTLYSVKQGNQFIINFELLAERIELDRNQRTKQISVYAQRYARRLEQYCLCYPLQWYNFFDFWRDEVNSSTAKDVPRRVSPPSTHG